MAFKKFKFNIEGEDNRFNLFAYICTRAQVERICKPFRYEGNLYYIGTTGVSSHLIDTGEGLIVIDTLEPSCGGQFIESFWELGFDPRDVKMIFHTHNHVDHIGCTNLLKAISGATTYMGAQDIEDIRTRPYLTDAFKDTQFIADVAINDGDCFTLGNTTIRCVHAPGHTPGTQAFFFNVTKEDGTQLTAGIHGGVGFNTLDLEFCGKNNMMEMRKAFSDSLDKIENEKVDIVLGSHPGFVNTMEKRQKQIENPDVNPFIDPLAWDAFIKKTKQEYREFLDSGK
ncbi:MAG: MBL fold metallo-hydrolase [Oscillospiraceae bacterium]|nr:MBL fold metallo-hydrolase [Oscillospiraceae bacterium]